MVGTVFEKYEKNKKNVSTRASETMYGMLFVPLVF